MPIVVENGIDIGNGITITSGPGGGGSVVTSGLQVQLRPDSYVGSGTIWNDTQNNADATLIGSPGYSATGFAFDGLTTIATLPSINNVTNFGNADSWTIEVWFRPGSSQYNGSSAIIMKYDFSFYPGQPNVPYFLEYAPGNNSVSNGWRSSGSGVSNYLLSPVYTNTWYQDVIVYNWTNSPTNGTGPNTSRGFLNAVQVINDPGTSTVSFSDPSNNFPVGIGGQINGPTTGHSPGWFTGDIGIVRIYNRALTSGEVLQNFNADRSIFGI